ncbi:hypothetical protein O8W32_01695 [Methanomassiliicoccales archaeon LGM-DZ1]|nr:hypothetical protein O8W32_01695 [Methanomassiliicoccales archaeon LGM-DZ1]
MTVLDEFYAGYLHYTVAFRLWTDTCRQLADCKGSLDERQALVDETLRLSMCVADNIDEVESLIADTLEYIQSEDTGDPDLLGAISLITNNLKEDRARADDYTRFVMRRRSGGKEKRPRRPQIANPFVYVPQEDSEEELEENINVEEPDSVEESPEAESQAESVTEEEEQGSDAAEEPSEETVEEHSDNPLAEESERIAEEQKNQPPEVPEEQEEPKKKSFFGRGRK